MNLFNLKQFLPDSYARNLVLKTSNLEIILVCWLPGQASPLHGHGPSDAVMVILQGVMTYRNVYPDGSETTGKWLPGDIGHAPVGVQHQIANYDQQPLTTLHIYSPPLETRFQGFDLGYANDVQFEEVQLQHDVVTYVMGKIPPVAVPQNQYVI